MIIVNASVRVNKQFTADFRKKQAIGTIDEYGNPFRIIRLRWNKSRLHKNTDYAKTRGFEDTVIGRDTRDGQFKITYRPNGSVMWMREGGEGPYYGELAQTPKNMNKLASMYGDRLFTIVDQDIEAIVKKMYEKRREAMPDEVKSLNDKRIRFMHISEAERGDEIKGAVQIPPEVDKVDLAEQRRLNEMAKMDNEKRKALLDQKEEEINKKSVDLVGDGVAAVTYTKEYLEGLKGIQQLRRICRELKITSELTDKRDTLIAKIIQKQVGDVQAVKKQMDEIIGGGLDE